MKRRGIEKAVGLSCGKAFGKLKVLIESGSVEVMGVSVSMPLKVFSERFTEYYLDWCKSK